MSLGPLEIILILVVLVMVFGAGRIPRLMEDVAKGIKAFKHGLKDEDAPKKIDQTSEKP